MKKPQLAYEVAKRSGVKPGQAADQVDQVVTKVIRTLKEGRPARLPGLGTIKPGKQWTFEQERNEP